MISLRHMSSHVVDQIDLAKKDEEKSKTYIDWIGDIIIVVSQVAAPAHVSIVQVLLILVTRIIVTLLKQME